MNFNSLLELTDKSNNEFYPTPKPIVSKMLNTSKNGYTGVMYGKYRKTR